MEMKFFLLAVLVAAVAAAPAPRDENQAVEVIVNGVPEGEALELGGIVDINLKEHVNGQLASSSDLLHPYTAVGLAEAAIAAAEAVVPSPVEFADQAVNTLPEAVIAVPAPVDLHPPVQPIVLPAPVDVPAPVQPIVLPAPVDLPAPVQPIVLPAPVDIPAPVQPIVLPAPVPVSVISNPEATPLHPSVVPPPSPIAVQPIPGDHIAVQPVPVQPAAPEVLPAPAAQGPQEYYNDGLVQVQVNGDTGVFSTLQSWFNLIVNYFSNDVHVSHQIV